MDKKIKDIQWDSTKTIGSTPVGNYLVGKAGVLTPNGIFYTTHKVGVLGPSNQFISISAADEVHGHKIAQEHFNNVIITSIEEVPVVPESSPESTFKTDTAVDAEIV